MTRPSPVLNPLPPPPFQTQNSALRKPTPDCRGRKLAARPFSHTLCLCEHTEQLGGDGLHCVARDCVKDYVLLYCIILYAYVS